MNLLFSKTTVAFIKKYLPGFIVALTVVWLGYALRIPAPKKGFDSVTFGGLPVLGNARIKPMETVATNSLLMLHGKATIENSAGEKIAAVEWLMDMLMRPAVADNYKVFLINDPNVLGLFHWDQARGKDYSFNDLLPFVKEIEDQAAAAEGMRKDQQGLFQRQIIKLHERVILYDRLKNSWHSDPGIDFAQEIDSFQQAVANAAIALREKKAGRTFSQEDLDAISEFVKYYKDIAARALIRVVPKAEAESWQPVGESLQDTISTGIVDPAVAAYAAMTTSYRQQDKQAFNKAVADYRSYLEKNFPQFLNKTGFEYRFDRFEPFYKCMIIYVGVFLLALFSWLFWPATMSRAAFLLLVTAFALHTVGLVSRMWIQGRPPVTNLYSSAIFVGWAACLLCIFLEKIHRNGIGSLTAAVMGFITLIIAHHLSFEGDTMEMMQAVLDTNFWLATHVVAVTIGYSATFLAGFLAILYVIRGMFTPTLDKATAKSLANMVYGIACFAMLFSFVGTVLGGIWADQSWGRFWGFDPKENGALLIVIWNAVILHARWGGFIRERGLINMAMFGNIVTSFSWFGVNMLQAGLHSYGFMDKAAFWLWAFVVNQLLLIGVGMLPLRYWRSFMDAEASSQASDASVDKAKSA